MARFTNTWFRGVANRWINLFDDLKWNDGRPLTIIEIGSFEGQATLWMLANLARHPQSRIYCLDTFEGSEEHSEEEVADLEKRFASNISGSPYANRVTVYKGLSRRSLLTLSAEGVVADLVYVDGSHQAADVLDDLVLSFQVLRPGGVAICDDYLWSTPHTLRHGGCEILKEPKIAIDSFLLVNTTRLSIIKDLLPDQMAFRKLTAL
ncbi:class I SAM-dependent methyltransferase [Sphingomonas gei]|uniref:Class I SAM-dependent methyltransferase n=1 Tax=Sphingomonas gei TaxID=1395960 RepID=A0A4V3QY19_9SPHN|nr:class I SAM-dependent methyltransferase [Sphingomonas gei]TGX48672.1 class I SAM-dependent methyltransferase [Sphingomonas gei]